MRRIKIGLIGLGEVAQVIHLPVLELLKDRFEISAVCDISDTLVEAIGMRYGVPESGRHPDYAGLVRQPDLDAVMVLNPDAMHASCAIAALRAGKHVFVEKPVCLTLEDAEAVIAAEREAGKQVMVGYMRRFAPAFRAAIAELQHLGPVQYAHLRAIIGANALFVEQTSRVLRPADVAPADLEALERQREDQLRAALGGEASAQEKRWYRLLNGLSSHDLSAMRQLLGMPRAVVSSVVCGNYGHFVFDYGGFIASYEVGTDRQRRFDAGIEVFGTHKTVKVQYNTPYIRQLPTLLHVRETDGDTDAEREVRPTFKDAYVAELEHWHAVVAQGADPVCTAEDALQDLVLFRQIMARLVEVRE
ncbi:Gfo/Idh/MocA family oxidoreductase [Paenibacillus sp. IB182496]|uniref:Gfo/Idh/MocA family oxidoreductase n=1 Tax=Paenibacillus sabuli TaxID=2772509 RepID=A0A927GUB9_9BACL|nr:Gfo/Idh/MocA family oxidoreductase [Paenibacillus sabuli]MBD2848508.1 Gfo/Idh/MocA family oxidoreductase [Paenibacillus sabuli]